MTVDEQIRLAEQIARHITEGLKRNAETEKEARELIKASRNEWMRWLQITKRYGLEKGEDYARCLGEDITMRSNIQKINQQIAKAINSYKRRLNILSYKERNCVLSYIAWHLRIFSSSLLIK